MTTGKTIGLTIWAFVSKVTSLLCDMLSSFVIAFLGRKHLLEEASFNFMVAGTICSDFGAQEKKVCHCFHFHCFPIYLPWSDGTRCHDLSFLNAEFYAKYLPIKLTLAIFTHKSLTMLFCFHTQTSIFPLKFSFQLLAFSRSVTCMAGCFMWPTQQAVRHQ